MSANASKPPMGTSSVGGQQASRAREKLKAFHEEDALGKAYDTRLLKRLWPFVKPHAKFIYWALGLQVVLTAALLCRPLLMGNLVERASAKDGDGMRANALMLVALLVVHQIVNFAQQYSQQIAGARAMGDLRAHIFLFMQRLKLSYFDRTPVGRLVTRTTNDVDAIGELFASGVVNAGAELVTLVGYVICMLALNVRLSLITFALMPFVALLVNWTRKRSRMAYRDIRAKTARLNSFLNEQVSGIAIVQAYARETATATEFDEVNESFREANKRSIYYEAILDAAIEMVSILCIASILWYAGFNHIGEKAITFGVIVKFAQYVKQFFEPISTLATRYTLLQSAMAGAERIFGLLDVDDSDAPSLEAAHCVADGPADEAIALDDVTFEYKTDVPVLKDVSFTVKRGEKVALVGATGAGKTTVASVVLRLYETKSGCVRVLGKDVRSYDRHALRENFSVVPQDVFLFAGSVLSNVAMSDPHPDKGRAEAALAKVGALEMFNKRGGVEAKVDERGANFSAGERQLLAFARAVYRDAPLLILDEATASIDSDTEARLQLALDAVMQGRTAIVIAHRLSTIRAVDRIVVFHKGRVVESGRHEDLLAQGGVYARLYRLQFAHERALAVEAAVASVAE